MWNFIVQGTPAEIGPAIDAAFTAARDRFESGATRESMDAAEPSVMAAKAQAVALVAALNLAADEAIEVEVAGEDVATSALCVSVHVRAIPPA